MKAGIKCCLSLSASGTNRVAIDHAEDSRGGPNHLGYDEREFPPYRWPVIL